MKLNPKLLLDMLYPIGSIYINTTGVNPGTFLGGTWSSFGTGRCLVGQDASQTEFDTLEETGGSKYLQRHIHDSISLSGTPLVAFNSGSGTGYKLDNLYNTSINVNTNNFKTSEAGTGDSGNLQPYIVVSMWKRTA